MCHCFCFVLFCFPDRRTIYIISYKQPETFYDALKILIFLLSVTITFINWPYIIEHFLLATDAHNVKKNVDLLKHSKINKNAPTCFGLHGNVDRNVLITLRFLTLCASVANKKCSTLLDARCNHEVDRILITNFMHWLLFIHKILFSSTCFEPQVLIFRRIQLYTCSIWYCHSLWEFVMACRYTAWVRTDCRGEGCW